MNKRVHLVLKLNRYEGVQRVAGIFTERPLAEALCDKLDAKLREEEKEIWQDDNEPNAWKRIFPNGERYEWYEVRSLLLNKELGLMEC